MPINLMITLFIVKNLYNINILNNKGLALVFY
jgi:hypothetical protein